MRSSVNEKNNNVKNVNGVKGTGLLNVAPRYKGVRHTWI